MRALRDWALTSRGWPVWSRYAITTSLVFAAACASFVIGFPRGHAFLLFFPAEGEGFGRGLAQMLAAQLGGGLRIEQQAPRTAVVVTFPRVGVPDEVSGVSRRPGSSGSRG